MKVSIPSTAGVSVSSVLRVAICSETERPTCGEGMVQMAVQQPAFDGKQETFIGQFFRRGIEMDQLAKLDRLPDSIAISCPSLDGIHGAPPWA
jgi:hypothetical protein